MTYSPERDPKGTCLIYWRHGFLRRFRESLGAGLISAVSASITGKRLPDWSSKSQAQPVSETSLLADRGFAALLSLL